MGPVVRDVCINRRLCGVWRDHNVPVCSSRARRDNGRSLLGLLVAPDVPQAHAGVLTVYRVASPQKSLGAHRVADSNSGRACARVRKNLARRRHGVTSTAARLGYTGRPSKVTSWPSQAPPVTSRHSRPSTRTRPRAM